MDVVYYAALSSPYTYMGHERFETLAASHGARVTYRVVDVGRVFKVAGTLQLPDRPPQRQAYRMMELKRWRKRLGLPLNLEPAHFPVDQGPAARMVTAAQLAGANPGSLIGAYLRAVWVEERNIADGATVLAIAEECGLDAQALSVEADGDAVKEAIERNTDAAIEDGIFGMPTWKIGDALFWGQDRLDFVAEALAGN